jgi:hypothetical protein
MKKIYPRKDYRMTLNFNDLDEAPSSKNFSENNISVISATNDTNYQIF